MKLILISIVGLLLFISAAIYLNYQGFFDRSEAFLSKDPLKIQFKLAKKDEDAVKQFSDNLGVTQNWTKGITLNLDLDNTNFLKDLPSKIILNFTPKEVGFSSQGLSLLSSSLPSKDYTLATGSAKLNLKEISDKSYILTINDPAPLLNYATASGKLYLTNSLSDVFPILSKIATINLKVNGGNLQGSIKLK